MEPVEGKYGPLQARENPHTELGNVLSLVLNLTRYLRNTNIIDFMDSVFYVLKYIIELKKVGIFSSDLTKKRCYWPNYVKWEDIKENLKGKLPG